MALLGKNKTKQNTTKQVKQHVRSSAVLIHEEILDNQPHTINTIWNLAEIMLSQSFLF
jgi:hypothetical protein